MLNRTPTAFETAQMSRFYGEVAVKDGKPNPNAAKDWVTLSCFATASSTENIFY